MATGITVLLIYGIWARTFKILFFLFNASPFSGFAISPFSILISVIWFSYITMVRGKKWLEEIEKDGTLSEIKK